jgi:hypothetical protein
MNGTRSTHLHRIRTHASQILGAGFDQGWFATRYNRESVEKLQTLSGAYMAPDGKKYRLLAPILYPETQRSKDIFLNPALIRVGFLFYQVFAVQYPNKIQMLKVILFGPSSLQGGAGKSSGPRPAGIKWGLSEVTPGAVALAAILVSVAMAATGFARTH